jgi:hypothetical protein
MAVNPVEKLLLGAVFFFFASGLLSAQTPDPVNCTGYPEPRMFLESQSWWTQTPGRQGNNFGHIHVGTCFPYKQRVSGIVNFDLRVIIHDNPGTAYLLRVMTEDSVLYQKSISLKCPVPGSCTFWFPISADTAKASHDGRNELRMSVKLKEPDGKVMFNSSGWQVYLENGKALRDYRSSDMTEARGWYTDVEYTNARLDSDIPRSSVSGLWTFKVSLKPGSGGLPVTYHRVILDPNFHEGIPGTTVKQGTGPYSGTITIDTRKLANGKHKLVLKSDAADSASGSTNSGLLVVPFSVRN